MGWPRWRENDRRRGVGSLLHLTAFFPLGFFLLQVSGCASGPGFEAAPTEEPRPAKVQTQPSQERTNNKVQRPVGNGAPPQVGEEKKPAPEENATQAEKQQPRKDQKPSTATNKQPSEKPAPAPPEDLPLPPPPSKPPAIGGTGG